MVSFALKNIAERKIKSIAIYVKRVNLEFLAELIHYQIKEPTSITWASEKYYFNLTALSMSFACFLNIYCWKTLLFLFLSVFAFIS